MGRKEKSDEIEISRNKDQNIIEVEEQLGNEDKESSAKKTKLFGNKDDNDREDGIVNMFLCVYFFYPYRLLHKLLLCNLYDAEHKHMKGRIQVQRFLKIVIWV